MAEVVAPDTLVDQRAWQHLARVAHEQLEEVRLGRRQLEAAAGPSGVHRPQVEREVGEAQHVGGLLFERGPEQRPQPREQLLERERLRQVVVGAGVQALDSVADGVPCGQEQNGDTVAFAAQPAGDVEPVVARHHHVQHDRIRSPPLDRRQCGVAV